MFTKGLSSKRFSLVGLAVLSSASPTAPKDKVDYVIIGGGPAGLVVAEKLTQNPRVTVTLLEAGPDADTNPSITSKSSPSMSIDA
jgi:hypothetical protein